MRNTKQNYDNYYVREQKYNSVDISVFGCQVCCSCVVRFLLLWQKNNLFYEHLRFLKGLIKMFHLSENKWIIIIDTFDVLEMTFEFKIELYATLVPKYQVFQVLVFYKYFEC